ncbi:unnamed protein product [Angiostrongylus costaricensis]|uniref:Ovule protein n=1 Tax=Angiostrongylus costaricensis TaxID=334426 RepID=A0A0R3PKX4_ANGCS|nr:unnamed protein product [Angiostrongylus costaricensis]
MPFGRDTSMSAARLVPLTGTSFRQTQEKISLKQSETLKCHELYTVFRCKLMASLVDSTPDDDGNDVSYSSSTSGGQCALQFIFL